MDPQTVTELRKEAGRIADLVHAAQDATDDFHRRLSAIEDAQSAYQSSVRRLRDVVRAERDAS